MNATYQNDFNLPRCRGKVHSSFELSRLSWLKVGGPAQVLFQPEDEDDLSDFLGALSKKVPTYVIGACSNLLIRDGGIPGVVIKLGSNFSKIRYSDDSVIVGAACLDSRLAKVCATNGIDLSFLRTVPGTIGGAVAMNAGCFGSYIADYFLGLKAIDRNGSFIEFDNNNLNFGYRKSSLPNGVVITEVSLKIEKKPPHLIEKKMKDALQNRAKSQPVKELSCGSIFRNPLGRSSTGNLSDTDHSLKAWKLIEDSGLRGQRLGGAMISSKHSNFMINTGSATAKDLEDLGNYVIKKVKDNSGIELSWEIKRVGVDNKR